MATRQDVANLAGTSPAVVSYVLNNGPRTVAPATRTRVLEAVRQLDYRPNAVARSLRMSHTMTIGLVVPDSANPFFAELARALEDHAWGAGYTLLVGNAGDDPDREAGYVRTFLDRQVDGLVIIPSASSRSWRGEVVRTRVPCLVFDREVEDPGVSQVLVDNAGGATAATAHLLDHGRRRVGCIAGPLGIHPTVDRVAGWRLALERAGLRAGSGSGGRTGWESRPDAAPLVHGAFGRHDGYLAGRALLGHDRAVDGLFVTSDEQAVGVLRAATELGIRVPDDLALVSFDGIAASAYTWPALSTMRQPVQDLGRTAIERLLARMADPDLSPSRDVLPVGLVARGSCGCPDPAGGA
ncbi:MAG: LacI family DNA-binding transcriptional regulator [Streptomycetaceae bacterium]|nr:LacI family DNA-binding transcriptional regulator [Streptomycetaceae bacterium]